jgi:tRNA pseudouridine55 synthase
MPDPCGLLLIDKPSGPTSHDLVYAVRRGSGVRRVGHAGTLDPLASGLLVMCLGPATRLSEYLAGKDKRYLARVRLGQATTTYDAQGEVTETHADLPEQAAVEAALVPFRGRQQQVPPAYSAIKRGGQKAYEMARRGEAVELDARPVEFYSLELIEWQPPELLLNVHCSAGTYIRSLAHDLGQRLGCGAHLSALRRTASGSFDLSEALSLEDLQAAFAGGDWLKYLRPPDAALADWPSVRLTNEAAGRVQRGQPVKLDLPAGWSGDAGAELLARAYNAAGDFIAVLRADATAGVWRPHKVFLEN